jgi:uncharacterized protein YjlB
MTPKRTASAPLQPRPVNPLRRKFAALLASLALGGFPLMAQQPTPVQPEKFVFADDGSIPNSKLPLLLYRQAFASDTSDLASAIEERFAENNWTGSWRASVFTFHHCHSTTDEVLAVYRGAATLQLGGEKGELDVKPGDVIVIPTGVGHKRLSCVRQVQQKGDQVRVGKVVRLIHKRSDRARLRQPEPRRDRAPALAPSQSNRFVNKPSHSL